MSVNEEDMLIPKSDPNMNSSLHDFIRIAQRHLTGRARAARQLVACRM